MNSGQHVVVKKPMSAALREADQMIRTTDKNGVHMFVHQNYRFSDRFKFFQELLKNGKIGSLAHVGYVSHKYNRYNDWQCLRKFSRGQINNKITHSPDQILAITNFPAKDIVCDMKHISDAGDVEDYVKMLLKTESGITIDMEDSSSAATTHQAPEWTFLGTCGAATLSGSIAHLRYYDPKYAPKIKVRAQPLAEGRAYGNKEKLP